MLLNEHFTYQEQVEFLEMCGLAFDSHAEVVSVLKSIGFYRLQPYLYPFRESLVGDTSGRRLEHFQPGVTLAHVMRLYGFDRNLRQIFLTALEAIEVAFCAQIGYTLGRRGAFAHLSVEGLDEVACEGLDHLGRPKLASWLARYEKLTSKTKAWAPMGDASKRTPENIPIWIATEFMDFGNVVTLYEMLKKEDRLAIANYFGLSNDQSGVMRSWMRSLNDLRNRCAHNNRIWNFTQRPPRRPAIEMTSNLLRHFDALDEHQLAGLYGSAAILAYLTRTLNAESTWFSDAKNLFQSFGNVFGMTLENTMGFPDDWENLALWN